MLIGRSEVPRGRGRSALLDNRHLLVSNVCPTLRPAWDEARCFGEGNVAVEPQEY